MVGRPIVADYYAVRWIVVSEYTLKTLDSISPAVPIEDDDVDKRRVQSDYTPSKRG
jgi:hypothetical protein